MSLQEWTAVFTMLASFLVLLMGVLWGFNRAFQSNLKNGLMWVAISGILIAGGALFMYYAFFKTIGLR